MSNVMGWLEQVYVLLPGLMIGLLLLALVGIWIECKGSTTKQTDNEVPKFRR